MAGELGDGAAVTRPRTAHPGHAGRCSGRDGEALRRSPRRASPDQPNGRWSGRHPGRQLLDTGTRGNGGSGLKRPACCRPTRAASTTGCLLTVARHHQQPAAALHRGASCRGQNNPVVRKGHHEPAAGVAAPRMARFRGGSRSVARPIATLPLVGICFQYRPHTETSTAIPVCRRHPRRGRTALPWRSFREAARLSGPPVQAGDPPKQRGHLDEAYGGSRQGPRRVHDHTRHAPRPGAGPGRAAPPDTRRGRHGLRRGHRVGPHQPTASAEG